MSIIVQRLFCKNIDGRIDEWIRLNESFIDVYLSFEFFTMFFCALTNKAVKCELLYKAV